MSTIAVEDTNVTQEVRTSYFRYENNYNYRFYTMENDHDLIVPFGQNQAHNNISPVVACYCWRRTA